MSEGNSTRRVAHYLPALTLMRNYQAKWLRPDLLAGLTASAVVIPQAMAYAGIAGLSVEAGLYTAVVPMLAYALLGRSSSLSVSTTSTIAILTASALASVVISSASANALTAAATLSVLTGSVLLVAWLLRLGFLSNFVSLPVLTGFKAGIGVVIFVGQLGKVIGVSVPQGPFLRTVQSILSQLDVVHWPTVVVSLGTMAILLLLPRWAPRLPAPLVAVGAAILASAMFNFDARGIALVGSVPSGLPAPKLPDLGLIQALWPAALGIALMSFTESIAAGRAFLRQGERFSDPDQELLALGIANVGGGLFQAMPAGGGTSQTAVNSQAGAKTQVAAVVTTGVVVVVLLFLAPVVSLLPQAALGALVLVAAAGLVKLREFNTIASFRREELVWAIIAALGVTVLGTLQGILLAVVISVFNLFYHANHPPIYALGRKPGTDVFRPVSSEHPEDETYAGLLMVRTEGRMHFASAPRAGEGLRALMDEFPADVVALDLSAVPDIEYTALTVLTNFEDELRASGRELWLVALNPRPFELIMRTPLGEKLGHRRMFINMEAALEHYLHTDYHPHAPNQTIIDNSEGVSR